jgi:hypothetical protein
MFIVTATIQGIGPILVSRPYPRADHCDPFRYNHRHNAERFAAKMRAQFPGNVYQVEESE